MNDKKLPAVIFSLAFIVILYLIWLMAVHFLGAIIFGAIMAGSFYPVKKFLHEKLKLNHQSSAVIVCFLIVVCIFLPLVYITVQLSKEGIGLYAQINQMLTERDINDFLFGEGAVATLIKRFGDAIDYEFSLEIIREKILNFFQSISGELLTFINSWLGNILSFLFHFTMMLLMVYALLSEGPVLKKYIMHLSPLPSDQEELLIDRFNQMNYVSLVCNGLGALIQGILAGIGLWLTGFSSILMWTVMMIILAFIPLIGISVVYIPACIYLLLKGAYLSGILLAIWCTMVAVLVENWFKPKFIGNRIKINSLFILACIVGGMSAFGMAGIFYGPIIGILFLTAVNIYHQYYSPMLD